jgi:hypothetical protein
LSWRRRNLKLSVPVTLRNHCKIPQHKHNFVKKREKRVAASNAQNDDRPGLVCLLCTTCKLTKFMLISAKSSNHIFLY